MKTVNIFIAIYFMVLISGMVGWVMCIVKLCNCDFKASYKAEIFYSVGACTPLGGVIGYLDLGK